MYHQAIGKYYNMEIAVLDKVNNKVGADKYHDQRLLTHKRTEIQTRDGFERVFGVYACDSYDGCSLKLKCLYKYDDVKDLNKNKEMKVNCNQDDLKRKSEDNVLSVKGILYRQIISIQTEGSFGDMKHNHKIRHFNHRGEEKVYKEMLFYTMDQSLIKHNRFEQKELESFTGKAA